MIKYMYMMVYETTNLIQFGISFGKFGLSITLALPCVPLFDGKSSDEMQDDEIL